MTWPRLNASSIAAATMALRSPESGLDLRGVSGERLKAAARFVVLAYLLAEAGRERDT